MEQFVYRYYISHDGNVGNWWCEDFADAEERARDSGGSVVECVYALAFKQAIDINNPAEVRGNGGTVVA